MNIFDNNIQINSVGDWDGQEALAAKQLNDILDNIDRAINEKIEELENMRDFIKGRAWDYVSDNPELLNWKDNEKQLIAARVVHQYS